MIVELDEELPVDSGPYSYGPVFAATEDVIGVSIDTGHGPSVGVGDLPQDLPLLVVASDEAVSPACEDGVVVPSDATAGPSADFPGLDCQERLVL